jgi:hypothetical protein
VEINCAWLPFVRGALQQLLLQATWSGDLAAVDLAQQRAFNLIDLFRECPTSELPFACAYDFSSSQAIWDGYNHGVSWTPAFFSSYTPGSGFEAVAATNTGVPGRIYGDAACQSLFASTMLTHVDFSYDLVKGAFDVDDGNQTGILIANAGVIVATQLVHSAAQPDGANSISWDGSLMADNIALIVQASNKTDPMHAQGIALISGAHLAGTGTPPC